MAEEGLSLRFIGNCCAYLLAPERKEGVCRLANRVDWQEVQALQERHGLQSLVWTVHRQIPFLPRHVTDVFSKASEENQQRAIGQLYELKRVLREAQERELKVLTFKGPSLSYEFFGSFFFRTAKDLDLICPAAQTDAFGALLEDLGYVGLMQSHPGSSNSYCLPYFNAQTGVLIELHCRPFQNTRLPPAESEVWVSSRRLAGEGLGLPVMSLENLFLHLLAHGALHGWVRLKWLLDIAMLLRHWTPPPQLLERADKVGLGSALQDAAMLHRAVFGFDAPQSLAPAKASFLARHRVSLSQRCLAADDPTDLRYRAAGLLYRLRIQPGVRNMAAAVKAAVEENLHRLFLREPGAASGTSPRP